MKFAQIGTVQRAKVNVRMLAALLLHGFGLVRRAKQTMLFLQLKKWAFGETRKEQALEGLFAINAANVLQQKSARVNGRFDFLDKRASLAVGVSVARFLVFNE